LKPVVQPELRFRRWWLSVGVLLVLAITVVCLLPSRDLPKLNLWDKAEHAIAFGALAFWFGSIVVRPDLPWVGIAVVAFGGLIELAQGALGGGRDAEWGDVAADAVGVALGLALALTPLGRWASWFEAQVAKVRS
jgi:VanZ family protein